MNEYYLRVEAFSRSREKMIRPEHIHNYHEIYYLASGKARHFVDGDIIDINVGEMVFVHKGLIHATAYNIGEYSNRITICFDDDFMGNEYAEIIKVLGMNKYIKVPGDTVKELVTRICSEFNSGSKEGHMMCRNLIGELLILLYRSRKNIPEKEPEGNEEIIRRAVRYISENYADNLTLPVLADIFSMSEGHFSKTFKALTGLGVVKYITLIRIAEAEKLLTSKIISVTETAMLCGFNDSNYFATVFKRIRGITPYQFYLQNNEVRRKNGMGISENI